MALPNDCGGTVIAELPLTAPGEAAAEVAALVRSQLEHAVDGARRGLRVYQSLYNLNEVIGTQYGDRVLYELIQNAHDAHDPGERGTIAIRLVVLSETEGVLYVANGGTGFRRKDVDAVRNIAVSGKEIGEGIGNKGLGFRSTEALTDDVQIFSQATAQRAEVFNGYCFRFASAQEIRDLITSYGTEATLAARVASTIPRYLVPLPISEQSDDVRAFARGGYATVVVVPLQSAHAVALATTQVQALAALDVPLLLFLDRIGEVIITTQIFDQPADRKVLRREPDHRSVVSRLPGCSLIEVEVGEGRRFLVVRCALDRTRVVQAVTESIPVAPQLKRWLNWKGDPVVSIAVGLSDKAVVDGRLYNFLPMGETAIAPLLGYLDAPFFADIDRRRADLELPLNAMLISAAAEACVAAAFSIIEQGLAVPAHAVLDFIAWTGDQAPKLDAALQAVGSYWRDARLIPAIPSRGDRAWSSLAEIRIWPKGRYGVLTAAEAARCIGTALLSPDLEEDRVDRLRKIATRIYISLQPTGEQLAAWSGAVAQSLLARKANPRTWSRFYDDLITLFTGADLSLLKNRRVFLDQTGKLRSPGEAHVFLRPEATKGKRSAGGMPMPPSTLTRRYRFLDERIRLHAPTRDALVRAGLLQVFDPVVALAGLRQMLGANANNNRRQEALLWAFGVWRAAGVRVEEILQSADLPVLTFSGWHPASQAAFSASWTSIGRSLEQYLFEAAEVSADCKQARERLLVSQKDWPVPCDNHWVRFLDLLGVTDGLLPVPATLPRDGHPPWYWASTLREKAHGFDDHWWAAVSDLARRHPYTPYQLDGAAWRLPGQLEYEQLSEAAREVLCTLIIEHLRAQRTRFFAFRLGRFDRERDQDVRKLPSPLATFIRSTPWIAASTREGTGFRRPGACWSAKSRRGAPPRFVDRVPESLAVFAENPELAAVMFGNDVGLRDWQDKTTAVARLSYLPTIAADIASHDRPTFRREYQRAWEDVADTHAILPADLTLVVNRLGQITTLAGDAQAPPAVIVCPDVSGFQARILSAAGRAVLDVGEAGLERVTQAVQTTGCFSPLRLDGIGVTLVVDGEPFVPSAQAPLLTSLGLEWLPEVLVIGHELRGEQLERGVLASTVDRRARAIRVRRCGKLALLVEGHDVSPADALAYYAIPDDKFPTLILADDVALNWNSLAHPLGPAIARLIDPRLRAPENLLLKLALDDPAPELGAPSDAALARALDGDVQTIADHRAALRTDLGRMLHLLAPVVACISTPDAARQMLQDAEKHGAKFDPRSWLHLHIGGSIIEELLRSCEQAGDRAEVRRLLHLDFAAFNNALLALGEPPVSNESRTAAILQRVPGQPGISAHRSPATLPPRRFPVRAGARATEYLERKSLTFLPFNAGWVLEREALDADSGLRSTCASA